MSHKFILPYLRSQNFMVESWEPVTTCGSCKMRCIIQLKDNQNIIHNTVEKKIEIKCLQPCKAEI